jgi:hypothetical protein
MMGAEYGDGQYDPHGHGGGGGVVVCGSSFLGDVVVCGAGTSHGSGFHVDRPGVPSQHISPSMHGIPKHAALPRPPGQ